MINLNRFKKAQKIFSNIVIVLALSYCLLNNIIVLDTDYILSMISDVIQDFDMFRSIKGGRALDPYDFVDF